MIKRFFRRLFGIDDPPEKTEFDAAVDELNKTINQLDRDIQIIRSNADEARRRRERMDEEWERFRQKLPTDKQEK